MPQGPIATLLNVLSPAKVAAPANADALGALLVNAGGQKTALNQTATAVIKATAGRVYSVVINAPGSTSGAFALNDAATTGAAAAGNLIWEQAYNATGAVEGQVISFPGGIPFSNGLVLTVPGAGSPIATVVYA